MSPPKINNPAEKKKISKLNAGIIIGVVAIILFLAAAAGTAMDLSVGRDGEIQNELLLDNLGRVLSSPETIMASLKTGGYALQIAFFTALAIGIFALYKYTMNKKRLHRKNVEHGSAEFGTLKEMQTLKDREVISKDKKTGFVKYGKVKQAKFKHLKSPDGKYVFDDEGEFVGFMEDNNIILTEEVYMSLNTRQHFMNLNVLIIGGSGSGKTRYFAKPNILQLNTSYVITDPKGEILQAVGKTLVEAGYKLKVLNLIELEHSNNYNPFHYVYDYKGNISESNVTKMINVFMSNTKGEGEKDDFWSQSANKIITAIVFLLFAESEYDAEFDDNGNIIPETRDKSNLNFFSVTEKMRKLRYPSQGNEDGFFFVQNDGESDEDFMARRKAAFLCPLDEDFIELQRRHGETLATRLYKEIRNSPQETGQSILATAGSRTQEFNKKAVADLTCCDNIGLETLGDEKTALFLIISATDATFNFLAAMLYTQMFDVLANRANFKYGGVLPIHVRCIMDEFANIGEIPDFDKVIAFVRSMGMSLNVIIQNMAQLKARYEKNWEVITGNCDSLLFLGGKETSTLKEISEALGKETIDVEGKNRTITGGHKSDSTAESNSILGRELMTQDELQKMPSDKCILMIRSHNPFYCNKYPLQKHPNYRFTEDFDEKNKFDKSTICVKTLSDFMSENNTNTPKKADDSADPETLEAEDTTHGKLRRIFPKPGEEIEVDIEPLGYDDDFESYAEAEEFGGGENFEINESYIDVKDESYGIFAPERSLDLGEPMENYESEIDYTETIVEDNTDDGKALGESSSPDGSWCVFYEKVHEDESFSELTEDIAETLQVGQTEIAANAIKSGYFNETDFMNHVSIFN